MTAPVQPQPRWTPLPVRLLLLVAAEVLILVYALIGFGVIDSTHPAGWLGAALAAFVGSFL